MITPTVAPAPAPRLSMWMAIALFFVLAIGGLFYVKWSPYYAKAFVAARDHTLGASIVSGNLPVPPEVGWQAGFAYSIAYLKAIWQAMVLGLVIGAGIEALLPRMTVARLFTGSMGSLRASAFAVPSMMCTCCSAPIAVGMLESGAGTACALVYWLANPVLNPAALVFIGFVLGWQWAALRLVVGVALVFILADLAARFVSPNWRPAHALSRTTDANRHFQAHRRLDAPGAVPAVAQEEAATTARSISPLVMVSGSITLVDTTGFFRAAGGQVHSCETPTIDRPAPSA